MKRRDLLLKLMRLAHEFDLEFGFVRHGSEHDQFRIGNLLVPIPRHREINELTARGIIRDVRREVGREKP